MNNMRTNAAERRTKVGSLALKGKSPKEIQTALGISAQTVKLDLKVLKIIPVSNKEKANA